MGILAGDIKLVKSAVMDDVPEGGGAPTAGEIADAVSNSIFDDISELDRAGGRVNLRKVFVGVQTNNTDKYFGANVIVADPPADPNVSVTIFSTQNTFDTRSAATARVEAYLNIGPTIDGYLYENHITGQRSIQLMMRPTSEEPAIGRTLVLVENLNLVTEKRQYVRLTRVTSEERTFYDAAHDRDFQGKVVTCDLSDALRYDFTGSSASRGFVAGTNSTQVRDTVVADAATYYGVQPLSQAVAIGDLVAKAASAYSQIVPNARTEISAVDQLPSAAALLVLQSSPVEVSINQTSNSQRIRIGQENRGYNFVSILKPLPAPGTVRAVYRAMGRNYTITDDGAGGLTGSGAGTVNYLTGSISITLQALPDDRSGLMIYWAERVGYTNRSNQGAKVTLPEYGFQLEKTDIEPGSLTLTWTSGGVVKTATDNGTGLITGNATGEIEYPTGRLFFKPGAGSFPDPGAQFVVEYEWAVVETENHPGLSVDGTGSVVFTLAQVPVGRSIRVQWVTTSTISKTSGATTGGSSSTKTDSAGSTVDRKTTVTRSYTSTYGGSMISGGSLGAGQSYAGSTSWTSGGGLSGVSYAVDTENYTDTTVSLTTRSSTGASYSRSVTAATTTSFTTAHSATDDGQGPVGAFAASLGSVNYAGKTITIKVQADRSQQSYSSNCEDAQSFEALNSTSESTTGYISKPPMSSSTGGGGSTSSKGGDYSSQDVTDVFGANTLVVTYKVFPTTPQSHTETFTPPIVTLDLCPYTQDSIVPGSVSFTWMGTTYVDYLGVLYRGRTSNAPGIAAGEVNYTTGNAALSDYVVGSDPASLVLNSLWTAKRGPHVANVVFTTQVAPIKPTGIVVSVVDVGGDQIIATGDLNGKITGTHAHGQIDYETGQCEIQFGDYVLDSGLTAAERAEWWYSANDIRTDGKIWRPWPVVPSTLRYSAVAYFYLPLDATVLGLDPVRLPQDGRVPIYRPGAFAVLGHTGTVGPATVSNGQTINCARVRLSRVRVIGHDGLVISTGYTADLDAGTVTFGDVSGYSQPVTVEHRVEDMAMISDVQIDGTLSFTRQITHAYPVPGSYVSSALVAGDMRARVSLTFDQATWSNAWADAVSGSAATGTFNAVQYPITVTNAGALTERWVVQFTNSTSFTVAGEHVGVIASGNTSSDCAPLNPATGQPYFTIPYLGWGLGWATGNALRFNTVGSVFPVWVVRTVQQGAETVINDSFTLLTRGDVDRP